MELISVLFKIVQFKARKKNQAVILSLVLALLKKRKKMLNANFKKKFYSYVYSNPCCSNPHYSRICCSLLVVLCTTSNLNYTALKI